ncbi:MAG TPA: alginate lyase family protein [Luteolibacter sp.]
MKVAKTFFAVVVSLFLMMLGAAPARAFTHPGIPFTRDDLATLKANLGTEPWKSGYAALAADGRSQLGYVMQGPFPHVNRNFYSNYDHGAEWKNDMQAVFNLALMWSFTGDARYAHKSRDILIAWATTQTAFNGVEASFDLGDYAYCYAGGADILRGTWSGWTAKDTATVQNYFKKVFSPGMPRLSGSGSQGTEGLLASLAVAVFCDDKPAFDSLVSLMLTDGNSGLRNTLANGQVGDSGRDQGHTALYINNLALIAEIFWKQGVDLYSVWDKRILAAGEYYARFNHPGPPPPFVSFGAPFWGAFSKIGDTPRASGQSRRALNILHGAYTIRKGIPAPWIELYRDDQAEDAHSFLFRKSADSSTAAPPPPLVFPPVTSVTTGLASTDLNDCTPAGSANYANGTWTLTGGYNGVDPWSADNGRDTAHFAYKTITGDFAMVAKVTSVTGSVGAKAGIMVRDSLGDAAFRSWVAIAPGKTYERAIRGWSDLPYGSNAQAMGFPISQMPYWVKMERVGKRLQTFVSQTGGDWSPACTADFDKLPATLRVGLFTTSLKAGELNTATFTHVAMTGGDGGNPTVPEAPFSVLAAGTDRQVQLRWNESFGATGYRVKRATTPGGPYTPLATLSKTAYTDVSVVNGTTYYYVVSAGNAKGESANCPPDAATPTRRMLNIASAGSAEGSTGNSNSYESPEKAFDLNPGSKWLAPAPGWLRYDLGAGKAQAIKRYTITSANDVPERDPKDWQLQGSNNGSTWTPLDSRSGENFAYRLQTITYPIQSPAAYRYYRLNVTANHGADSTQLSEWGLLVE